MFGSGAGSYTVGSAEGRLMRAGSRDDCICLMDNGHFHPTEVAGDKISSILTYDKEMSLQEDLKAMPLCDVWEEYCKACGNPVDGAWFPEIEKYENEVLSKRG